MSKVKTYTIHRIITLLLLLPAMLWSGSIYAFSPDTYAGQSVLASGRWVKVQVSSTGLYMLPTATLRNWGFRNPEKVRVYGYGGTDISDVMTRANYTDDLPQVPVAMTSRGVVFYGEGPVSWTSYGRHYTNPYSSSGYYFVTETDDAEPLHPEETESVTASAQPQTEFTCRLLHEIDQVSPGSTGTLFVGEDFVYTRSRVFNFDLTGYTGTGAIDMTCVMFAKIAKEGSQLTFTANGQTLERSNSDVIPKCDAKSMYGVSVASDKKLEITGNKLALGVTLEADIVPAFARLDYIEISYPRSIALDDGSLLFSASSPTVTIDGASASTTVWDVTSPTGIRQMKLNVDGAKASWTNPNAGFRKYAAWNDGTSLPVPKLVGTVANQDLHGLPPADMIIFAPSDFMAQAERLADIHRSEPDNMTVHVIDQQQVFNEFGSGMAHPNAFRRMLKMFYDRGGTPRLRYALMMGRGSYDNRGLTAAGRNRNRMPLWQSTVSDDERTSFTTDDVFGHLHDGAGVDMALDTLSIAVGRIPATTVAEATTAVDKIVEYLNSMPKKSWKNRVLMLGDDGNLGTHINQSNSMVDNMLQQNAGQRFIYDKVYLDAYEKIDGGRPMARTELYRALNEGVLLWCFIGHANPSSLTGDKMVMPPDISSLYLRQYPVLYAATCEFLRWDGDGASGAEIMHFMRDGGTIASISSTRLAWISDNGNLSNQIGRMFTRTDESGQFYTLGEIYRRAKNGVIANYRNEPTQYTKDDNRMRYVFMGDPALRAAMPANQALLTHIDGVDMSTVDQPTVAANQNVTFSGHILDTSGNIMSDFNGVVAMKLYDADRSATVFSYDEESGSSIQVTYDQHGKLLYSGNAEVRDGRFDLAFAMPSQIAENFREATVSLYAYAATEGDSREAAGTNRNLFVYGYDGTVTDDVTPDITFLALNHEGFRSGDNVNEAPMLLANVSDDRGINLSMAGVGHQMNITVDDVHTYTDVASYYTPDPVATANPGGSISYPLENLTPGHHKARLRVWDTSGNMAERTIEFNVVTGLAPNIYEVYTDANPATTVANFYIKHDRPDSRMTVTVSVYNLLGQPLWSSSATGRSDMFTTTPLTWNLTDGAGHRVPRGIYVYRATISTEGGEQTTASRKLAVAAE